MVNNKKATKTKKVAGVKRKRLQAIYSITTIGFRDIKAEQIEIIRQKRRSKMILASKIGKKRRKSMKRCASCHRGIEKQYDDRTPAVCLSLRRAKQMVRRDEGSLNEAGYYPLLVIEKKFADAPYGAVWHCGIKRKSQWWYKYDHKVNKWLPIERPEDFHQTIGFGIG